MREEMERHNVRDAILVIVLLALGLFFAGLAGYFWDNPNSNVFSFVSLLASAIGILEEM